MRKTKISETQLAGFIILNAKEINTVTPLEISMS